MWGIHTDGKKSEQESIESSVRRESRKLRRIKRKVEKYEAYYRSGSYVEAYTAHMDGRVERDPEKAIGGSWEEVGNAQWEFLINQGLRPHHKLLDIGCGTLRAGRHFIKHLDTGNYTGLDISPKAIEYGRRLVHQEGLSDKHPRLLVNTNGDFKFDRNAICTRKDRMDKPW